MLDYVKADKAVKNAVIAALVSAGVTAVLSVFTIFTNVEVLPVSPAFFVDIVVMLGLAFGVYKKSRVCAVLLLLYYLIGQISVWLSLGNVSSLPMALVFCYFYVQGIRGTFAYHSMTSNVSLDDEPKKTTEVTKRSIPGIISFTLGAGLFVTIVVIVLFGSGASQGIKIVIGLLMMTSILASVTGLVFGIVGLIQKNRRRLFSVLGVILNGLFSFLYVAAAVSFAQNLGF